MNRSTEDTLKRLRIFLLVLAGLMFIGTLVELWAIEHTREPVQVVPYILSAAGLIVIALALIHPARLTFNLLQFVMGLAIIGGAFGAFLHLKINYDVAIMLDPGGNSLDLAVNTVKGHNPLLAPGILAFAGILGLASAYQHPSLSKSQPERN